MGEGLSGEGLSGEGLSCECLMPFAWRVAPGSPRGALLQETPLPEGQLQVGQQRESQLREALLLLVAINHMEAQREGSLLDVSGADNPRLARMEAKLDLTLHLLARSLAPADELPTRPVWLGVDSLAWADTAPPPAGTELVLVLQPSVTLPLSFQLPALALAPEPGRGRARLEGLSEALQDALHQYVFRRHRQAIRNQHLSRAP